MKPVTLIVLPDNGRDDVVERDDYLDLPIPMPETAIVIVDQAGAPVSINVEGGSIRPQDLSTVWEGINQYNDDLADLVAREEER
jgi:hypothetical protein